MSLGIRNTRWKCVDLPCPHFTRLTCCASTAPTLLAEAANRRDRPPAGHPLHRATPCPLVEPCPVKLDVHRDERRPFRLPASDKRRTIRPANRQCGPPAARTESVPS